MLPVGDTIQKFAFPARNSSIIAADGIDRHFENHVFVIICFHLLYLNNALIKRADFVVIKVHVMMPEVPVPELVGVIDLVQERGEGIGCGLDVAVVDSVNPRRGCFVRDDDVDFGGGFQLFPCEGDLVGGGQFTRPPRDAGFTRVGLQVTVGLASVPDSTDVSGYDDVIGGRKGATGGEAFGGELAQVKVAVGVTGDEDSSHGAGHLSSSGGSKDGWSCA